MKRTFVLLVLASSLLCRRYALGAEVDARAEVAAAPYAASATQAASERLADAKFRVQPKEIEQLRMKVCTSAAETANLRSELASAEEKYVADLAERDRASERWRFSTISPRRVTRLGKSESRSRPLPTGAERRSWRWMRERRAR